MSTGSKNAKYQSINARVPHDIVEAMERCKRPDESTSQFIITSIQTEIVRRLNDKDKN
ncbi:YlcI/YnfO family protein [Yersinia alsatica]|uniref:YlcI/YnfO family protein n=1 Tax=Yersinia alsatica TaxID=2890317 RepID=UPI002E26E636